MFRKTNTSIFAKILQEISGNYLKKIVVETGAERSPRNIIQETIWRLLGKLGEANSLREIEGGFVGCCGKLNRLGLKGAPAKSTLAYANTTRPADMFVFRCKFPQNISSSFDIRIVYNCFSK